MKDLDDKLSDDDKNDLNDALEKLKKANESSVVEDIKSEMENLNSVWSSKASSMYDASNANAQEPSPQEAESVSKEKSLWNGECFVFDDRVSLKHNLKEGSYDMCHGCRMPLSRFEKQSKQYFKGVACPKCYKTTTMVHM